jgi:hypothetical protein
LDGVLEGRQINRGIGGVSQIEARDFLEDLGWRLRYYNDEVINTEVNWTSNH